MSDLNGLVRGTMLGHLGIRFTEVGAGYLRGTMPVDERTRQPFGILHGGAYVVLAETLGSVASTLCVDPREYACVGLSLSSNHIRPVRSGTVVGTARPVHLGRRTHVWEIEIESTEGALLHVTRLTNIVLRATELAGPTKSLAEVDRTSS